MPRLASGSLPAYRRYEAAGQAMVTLAGQDHYLGPHGTKASRGEYAPVVSEWIAPVAGLSLHLRPVRSRSSNSSPIGGYHWRDRLQFYEYFHGDNGTGSRPFLVENESRKCEAR